MDASGGRRKTSAADARGGADASSCRHRHRRPYYRRSNKAWGALELDTKEKVPGGVTMNDRTQGRSKIRSGARDGVEVDVVEAVLAHAQADAARDAVVPGEGVAAQGVVVAQPPPGERRWVGRVDQVVHILVVPEVRRALWPPRHSLHCLRAVGAAFRPPGDCPRRRRFGSLPARESMLKKPQLHERIVYA